ncbi:MAG: hypothetical protein U0892_03670 [Pirellulales bacterium]
MVEVRNNGVPLLEHAPKAAITLAMQQLASSLCGIKEPEANADEEADASSSSSWRNFWTAKTKAKAKG